MTPDLTQRDAQHLFATYRRLPLEIERGEGPELITRDGTRYLDMFAGVAVNALGHGNRRVLEAIRDQAARYIHLSNYFPQEPQVRLAELLVRHSGYPRVFFANSGTESIEGAIKIARRYGSTTGRDEILSLSNAFHGRSMGALSLMDRPKYREGFEPLLPKFRSIPHNSVEALRESASERTAAVVLEFIQGEGGIRPVTVDFVAALEELRSRFGFLIVADEIQSGLGRTGSFLAFAQFNIRPDLVVLAKPLGGGLPLGAILATEEAASVLTAGSHGTTFGGNPVACAAGAALIGEIMEHDLMGNARRMGQLLRDHLSSIARELPRIVREVRGLGLMLGMELTLEGEPVVDAMREQRILINCTDTNVLRFVPPLIINASQVERTAAALGDILGELALRLKQT